MIKPRDYYELGYCTGRILLGEDRRSLSRREIALSTYTRKWGHSEYFWLGIESVVARQAKDRYEDSYWCLWRRPTRPEWFLRNKLQNRMAHERTMKAMGLR